MNVNFTEGIELGELLRIPPVKFDEDDLNDLASDMVAVADNMVCENAGDISEIFDDASDALKDAASALYTATQALRDAYVVSYKLIDRPWQIRIGSTSSKNSHFAGGTDDMQPSPEECKEWLLDGVSGGSVEASEYLEDVYNGYTIWAVNVTTGEERLIFDGSELVI